MTTTSTSFAATFEHQLSLLEERLIQAVPLPDSTVGDQIRDLVRAGGKRLRPSLTLCAASIYGANLDDTLTVASGIELLHTATLIHDDLVDNARERRGTSTMNAVFPLGLVVLSGDLLFAEAARLVAEVENMNVVRSFARALSEICHGELMQAQSKFSFASFENYYQRIYGKTASLFRTAAETGAMLGTDDPKQIEAMGEYGRLLGMAFQIIDDTLDFTSDAQKLGKPIGHDLRDGVISLPVMLYHQKQRNPNGAFNRVIVGDANESQLLSVIEAIKASGAVEESMLIAADFARQAREKLSIVPADEAREMLISFTHFAVDRDY